MAQQQPGQPVGDKKRKFNWPILIVSLIFIIGISVLIWYFTAGINSTEVRDLNWLNTQIATNADDISDNNYFEQIILDEYNNEIIVINSSDTSSLSGTFVITAPQAYFDGLVVAESNVTAPTYISDLQSAIVGSSGDNVIREAGLPSGTNWLSIILSFLPTIFLIGFFIWIARRSAGGFADSLNSPGKNQAQKIISKNTFNDIAGQEEAKEEVLEVVDFLKHPTRYKAAGARIPKGILFGGPPGTGKTLLAKATAGEAGVPFFFISASNFVEMFAGVGAKRVREMFKDVRKASPAILFIDELDAIGRRRGTSFSGNDEREQTLNQILVEMDGMQDNLGVLIIAATNRPDVLDPALLRPGRFDRTITVHNPDIREREAILKLHAKGKRISKEISFANIAKRTPGFSGAQLENIINEASLLSVREKTGVVTLMQVDEAIDRVTAGPAKKHRVISKEELTMVAYHEAGHAVIGLVVSAAEKVQKITIIPRGQAGGYTLMTPKKETYNFKKSELLSKIVSFMGGRAAEQIIYGIGEVSTGASNDIERATNIARAMVTKYGMSDLGPIAYEKDTGPEFLALDSQKSREYSDALAERIDEAVRKLIIEAEQQALVVINENRGLLELIVEELLEKETIVSEEIEYIFKYRKRPPKREAKVVGDKDMDSIDNLIAQAKKATNGKSEPKKVATKPSSKTSSKPKTTKPSTAKSTSKTKKTTSKSTKKSTPSKK